MRSTRACATFAGLPTSKTSQSPAQKSNCRYADAAQVEDFGDSSEATRPVALPSPANPQIAAKARTTTTAIMPSFNHQAIRFILIRSLFLNRDRNSWEVIFETIRFSTAI